MISILNDVIGPVMRGPSSSHTAGSFRIGRIASDLLGSRPKAARFVFDPAGSYAHVYREQGVDLAFAAALMGWELTDGRFFDALDIAGDEYGIDLLFEVRPIAGALHPNETEVHLEAENGKRLDLVGRSVGGGAVEITSVGGWPVLLKGDCWHVLVEVDAGEAGKVEASLAEDGLLLGKVHRVERGTVALVAARRVEGMSEEPLNALRTVPGVSAIRQARPVAFVKRGRPLFSSAAEMVSIAERRRRSLGRVALDYESQLLGISKRQVLDETTRRLETMIEAVRQGLDDRVSGMQLLSPSAGAIFRAERDGRVALGGPHARAAARAMAVMHVNSSMGVVCAAPTGGSAGTIPGVVVTMVEEQGLDRERAALALLAASAVGVVVGARATFAAEVAGCQVEIGAAGAMAAAAIVEAAGGAASQAADAAAIAFQNTMGSVCDLVQGAVEIPCHTRNAVAASSAFVCADLVLGGYQNPIPLDDTIDAVMEVGRMLPPELRCTAKGGLAVTPSALKLVRRRR